MRMNEAISSSNTAAPYSEYWVNSASYPQRDGGRCRTPFTASTQPPIPGGRHRTPSTGPTRPPIPSGTAGGAVLRVLGQLSLLSPAGRRAAPYSEYWANSASYPQRDGGRCRTPSTGRRGALRAADAAGEPSSSPPAPVYHTERPALCKTRCT